MVKKDTTSLMNGFTKISIFVCSAVFIIAYFVHEGYTNLVLNATTGLVKYGNYVIAGEHFVFELGFFKVFYPIFGVACIASFMVYNSFYTNEIYLLVLTIIQAAIAVCFFGYNIRLMVVVIDSFKYFAECDVQSGSFTITLPALSFWSCSYIIFELLSLIAACICAIPFIINVVFSFLFVLKKYGKK